MKSNEPTNNYLKYEFLLKNCSQNINNGSSLYVFTNSPVAGDYVETQIY